MTRTNPWIAPEGRSRSCLGGGGRDRRSRRVALAILLVGLLLPFALTGATGATATHPSAPGVGESLRIPLPRVDWSPPVPDCLISLGVHHPKPPLSLPGDAIGTGATATGPIAPLTNNTGINATLIVPRPTLDSSQFAFVGIEDPMNSTSVIAAGIGETGLPLVGTVATPAAYLPNGTEIYSETGPFLSLGSRETVEIHEVAGDWWSIDVGGHPVQGSAGWENGTYDLGRPTALGVACGFGLRATPSFLVGLAGTNTAPPSLPATSVPWAIGVEPAGTSTTSYAPPSANSLPQANATLGTVAIEGTRQNSSYPDERLEIGTVGNLTYPGANASLWGNYTVQDPVRVTVTPSSARLLPGQTERFSAAVVDSSGSFFPDASFQWSLSSPALGHLSSGSGDNVTWTAGEASGNGTLLLEATANCTPLSTTVPLEVVANNTSAPTIVSFTAVPSTTAVDFPVQFTVVVANQSADLVGSYTGLPPPCLSANASVLVCRPDTAGNFTVTFELHQPDGRIARAETNLTVDPDLEVVGLDASSSSIEDGETLHLTTTTSGGVPPLTYQYSGLPPGCPPAPQGPTIQCVVRAGPGVFPISVTVHDGIGESGSAATNVTVYSAPGFSIVGFTADPDPVVVGSPTQIEVTTANGTSPMTYSYLGLPKGCLGENLSRFSCRPEQIGSSLVTVEVRDALGVVASSHLQLTVVGPATPGGGLAALGSWGAPLLTGGIVGGAALLLGGIVLLRRRRISRRAPAPPSPHEGEESLGLPKTSLER
jgi:hypothetical protein